MKTALVEIAGVSTLSMSRKHDEPKLEGESHEDYDIRTWREHLHYDPTTLECFIPGIQLKFALDYTARQVGLKIPGRGTKTWATVFESGVICPDTIKLGVKRDDVAMVAINAHADGRRGSGKRVTRRFPMIPVWGGTCTLLILNDMITEEVLRLHLVKAGQFCGLGRFAPRNGGFNGRFEVRNLLWHDEAELVLPAKKAA